MIEMATKIIPLQQEGYVNKEGRIVETKINRLPRPVSFLKSSNIKVE